MFQALSFLTQDITWAFVVVSLVHVKNSEFKLIPQANYILAANMISSVSFLPKKKKKKIF